MGATMCSEATGAPATTCCKGDGARICGDDVKDIAQSDYNVAGWSCRKNNAADVDAVLHNGPLDFSTIGVRELATGLDTGKLTTVEDTDAHAGPLGIIFEEMQLPNLLDQDHVVLCSGVKELCKEDGVEVRHFVEANHCGLKCMCFLISVALSVSSILGFVAYCLASVWDPHFNMYQWLAALYNVLYACMVIIMDGNRAMFKRCGDVQGKLFRVMPSLVTQTGKAYFAIYVCSINFAMAPDEDFWWYVYMSIGCALCAAALLMLVHHVGRRKARINRQATKDEKFPDAVAAAKEMEAGQKINVKHLCTEVYAVRYYPQDNHCIVKAWCFFVGVCLFATSVLGAIDVFFLPAEPFEYLFIVYNALFAMLIIVMDGSPSIFKKCGYLQSRLFQIFPLFARQRGRAVFSWYVGSINLALALSAPDSTFLAVPDIDPGLDDIPSPSTLWGKIYSVIGIGLCISGIIMYFQALIRRKDTDPRELASHADGINSTAK
jgi:hypothetical protein